ncbi:MAG: phytoene/squalene synthase family protein [Bacteroidota bacterium]|nr:phytoene/squalene synthase family protein [Bacteroidota bacterium]
MKSTFDKLSLKTSELTTKTYSTSFSLGIKMLSKKFHEPIYSIYGFVRFADEIVDGFHDYDKKKLLIQFEKNCFDSIKDGISMNPILNSFQWVVNKYNIDHKLIKQFIYSMKMDLDSEKNYDQKEYEKYILGSAEVVGLMCLKVFVDGDDKIYKKLSYSAQKLGSAFQKINFLRDIKDDYNELGRTYFPNINLSNFNSKEKKEIESDIQKDFDDGYLGIKLLPSDARLGVYLAYIYYLKLFEKIKKLKPEIILKKRVRISNMKKFILMISSIIKNYFIK